MTHQQVGTAAAASWPTIATIPYLGSKNRFLHQLCPVILDGGRTSAVVDLFAGSGSVGYALRGSVEVSANDVQRYAYTLNQALLNGCQLSLRNEHELLLDARVRAGQAQGDVEQILSVEDDLLAAGSANAYIAFCNDTPSVASPGIGASEHEELRIAVAKVLRDKAAHLPVSEYSLFTTYYANTYFGVRQCVEIDAIRQSIEHLEDAGQKYVALTALMNAMSVCVSATTHYAQYLRPRDERTVRNLVGKRSQSVLALTERALQYYRSKGLMDRGAADSSTVGNEDYLDFLGGVDLRPGTVVYADPPYFKEHYSRYYHVLETLCLYDYPAITFNPRLGEYTVGRYRDDRFVSPFGRKSTAVSAFEQLRDVCADSGASIVLSYSDNSIVSAEEIVRVLSSAYDVTELRIATTHSTQGRKQLKDVQEIVLSAEPKVSRLVAQPGVRRLEMALREVQPVFETPLTGMHPYTARKPLNILTTVIETILQGKGTVLDPFAGSGTTLVAARRLGHAAIGYDLNHVSELVCTAALEPWPWREIQADYQRLLRDLGELTAPLFAVEVDGHAAVLDRCHFDSVAGELVPTSFWYRPILDDGSHGPRRQAESTPALLREYRNLEDHAGDLLADLSLIPNSRIAVPRGATAADFFCARNRLLLASVLELTGTSGARPPHYELLISAAVSLLRLSDKKASTQLPFWIPKTGITSRNGLRVLEMRSQQIIDALSYLEAEYQATNGSGVMHREAFQDASIQSLRDESVDLILTDPPYTDQVPYLEYSQLQALLLDWPMLQPDVLGRELVVSNAPDRPDKTLDAFNAQLALMLHRASRCLKPGGHMVVFFHDFSLRAWDSLTRAAQNAGLAYEGQVAVPRNRRSFKSILSPKRTLHGEYLVLFEKRDRPIPVFLGDAESACMRVCSIARDIVRAAGGAATSQDLYDKGLLRDSVGVGYLGQLADMHETFLDVVEGQLVFADGLWRLA